MRPQQDDIDFSRYLFLFLENSPITSQESEEEEENEDEDKAPDNSFALSLPTLKGKSRFTSYVSRTTRHGSQLTATDAPDRTGARSSPRCQ